MRRSFGVDKKLDTSFPFKRIGSADQISENGISYACVELAQGWIAECENSHKGCIINNDSVLPTRVVKVGSFQLIHASVSKPGECAPYAALSHCWGGLSPLTTTLKTLEKHVEGISFYHGKVKDIYMAKELWRGPESIYRKEGVLALSGDILFRPTSNFQRCRNGNFELWTWNTYG